MSVESVATDGVRDLLERVGARTPAPGGGAVTGVVASLASSLARMVVSYALESERLEAHRDAHREAADRLDVFRDEMLRLADEDALAYGRLNRAQRERDDETIAHAVEHAIGVPLALVASCERLLALIETLPPITSRMLRSDLAIAALLAECAARAAQWNVRMNQPVVARLGLDTDLLAGGEEVLQRCVALRGRIEELCA